MKFTQLKQLLYTVATSLAVVLSVSVVSPLNASATTHMSTMPHEVSSSLLNCVNQHHVSSGVANEIATRNIEDTDPIEREIPYFVQFQKLKPIYTKAAPKDIYHSSSFRPPDIVQLTSNIRF